MSESSIDDWVRITKWNELYRWPTYSEWRNLSRKEVASEKGIEHIFKRLGKSVYVNRRLFEKWLDEQV